MNFSERAATFLVVESKSEQTLNKNNNLKVGIMKTKVGFGKPNRINQESLLAYALMEAFFISPKLFHRAEALCIGG